VLEIDAIPDRLDLKDDHVRKAVEAGVALAIDSDAHDPSHLGFCDEYGLTVARRGWARKRDVLNTLPVDRLLARFGKG
jgi:DNA polymerase (family 10)